MAKHVEVSAVKVVKRKLHGAKHDEANDNDLIQAAKVTFEHSRDEKMDSKETSTQCGGQLNYIRIISN